MTVDDIEDLVEEFEKLSQDEKIDRMQEFKEKIEEKGQGDEDIDITGEFQVRVLDEDGNQKHKEVQNFKY